MPEPDLIELFVARLDAIGAHCLVTDSVAATLYGEPRATHDIELIDLTTLEDWVRRREVEAEWSEVRESS